MAQTEEDAAREPDNAETTDPQINPPPEGWRPPRRNPVTLIAIAAIALIAVLAILYAWKLPPFAGWAETTDNAYVRGQVTTISPQVSGYITAVPVKDFAEVRKGQVLATIDSRIYAARVEQAKANHERGNLANGRGNARRSEALPALRRMDWRRFMPRVPTCRIA